MEIQLRKHSIIQKNITFIAHAMGWLLVGFLLLINPLLTWDIDIPDEFWVKQIAEFALLILIYFLNADVLVPRMLIHNRLKSYTACVLGILVFIQVLSLGYDSATNLKFLLSKAWGISSHPFRISLDVFLLILTIMILALSTSITMVRNWQLSSALKEQSEKQRINAELLFLKSQINPHFFFNALNTIYSLSYTDVERSREALLKLSRMMRYALHKHEDDETLIADEITFIRDYVELMKLRVRKPTSISLEIEEVPVKAYIAPMLLIPFIENAFKYGAGSESPGSIKILVRQTLTHFYLNVCNTIFKPDEHLGKTSIGIANTSRRLNLLYPERHLLNYGKNADQNTFSVQLEIAIKP